MRWTSSQLQRIQFMVNAMEEFKKYLNVFENENINRK